MGKTKYPDTNNQFAYKTDREAFLSRIKSKAETLWLDGYRAILDPDHQFGVFLVWNDTEGMPAGYKVNAAEGTCTCPFCTDQEQFPLDPDHPEVRIHCKHVKGLKGLIAEEISYFKGLEETARQHSYNEGSRKRAEHYRTQWSALQASWNAAIAAYSQRRAA